MLELSGVTSSDVIYDLGCGDGRIIAEAAKLYGARAVGVEADPFRFIWSKATVRIKGVNGLADVIYGNFFHIDLSPATVVTLFLQQGTNQRLKQKLLAELRRGSRIATYTWTFEGWHPVRSDPANQIYIYEVGVSEKPAGPARRQ
ncbi:MAG: class I SAM-dependent methyltransferase [Nitrososphaerota archaeon]|jgi:predicted RNA methylase|nr:SAM-dependent methyltransferase [Nitrososphaerota archaeon]MDG6927078.1 class I SAM-dependent methyltransferase [Nitrososphaerota archaeon]MDG6929877.1 class I SAM-dependent methyltransferase [Nitrososphaerota archaeon]MDG6932355.1 class I SAM-dependent methyltransferase [Nitrososphaerota archaeon]MDG6935914.1 class I SAM-dependent methyltransferase [Nitrososphaerota archaeon]